MGALAGLTLLARLSMAQAPEAPPDAPSQAPEAPEATSPTTAVRLSGAASAPPAVEDVREGSLAVIRALLAKDLDALSRLTPVPFSFDGAEAATRAAVRQRWAALLERYPIDQLELRGVEVLSYDELVARYGKPPVRLQRLPIQGAQAAIIDLNGKGAVLLWRRRAKGFQLFAISD
jgi:hypothetical protein